MPRLNGSLPGIMPQDTDPSDMGIASQMLASPDAFGLHVHTEAAGHDELEDLEDEDVENMTFDQQCDNLQVRCCVRGQRWITAAFLRDWCDV